MRSLASLPLAALGALSLSACATTDGTGSPEDPPSFPGQCEAAGGQSFVGQRATAEIGRALIEATGAARLRWVPPRTAITMDFQADRLTVSYDDDMVIDRVSCT